MESKQAGARSLRKCLSPLSHSQKIKVTFKNAKTKAKKARKEQRANWKGTAVGCQAQTRKAGQVQSFWTQCWIEQLPGTGRGSLLCPSHSGGQTQLTTKPLGNHLLPVPLHPTLPCRQQKGFWHLRLLTIIIVIICNTHLTSTFLLNDSMAQRREKRVKREAEIRDNVQAQGKTPAKLGSSQAKERELSADGDRAPMGPCSALEGTDGPASRGGGLATRLQGNSDQQQGWEDVGAGE